MILQSVFRNVRNFSPFSPWMSSDQKKVLPAKLLLLSVCSFFSKADPKDIIGDIDDENDDEEDEDEDLPITPSPKLELKRHRLASYGSIKEEAIYSDPKSNGSRASANNSTASVHWNSSTIERQKNLDDWTNESELMTIQVLD